MSAVDIQDTESALRAVPDQALGWYRYGQTLRQQGALQRALNAMRVATALEPHQQEYCLAQSQLLVAVGEVEQALQLLASLPSHLLQGDLGRYQLYLRCYQPAMDTAALMETIQRAEHLSLGEAVSAGVETPRATDRPLRLAYLSSRWGDERWVRYLLPNLAYRQRGRFELFVYDHSTASDEALERPRRYTDRWVKVAGWGAAAFQSQLLADQIDLLVDLDGYAGKDLGLGGSAHARPWRLVSWLGMPWAGTTDGVLADAVTLPETLGMPVRRLPFSGLSWMPPEDIPAPSPVSPSRHGAQITLASFNPPAAFSAPVVSAWAAVLRQLPAARLWLQDEAYVDPLVVKAVQQKFAREGVELSRVRCGVLPTDCLARLRQYQEVDVALDTFPVSGYISSCEALWMGVPVVTLQGLAAWQNTTASVLAATGMADCITDHPDAYVDKVLALAGNTDARDAYRQDLREWVELSPLCAGRLFVRHFEHGLAQIWRTNHRPATSSAA